jgi:L-aminopeptidase/D-esterase-like protein
MRYLEERGYGLDMGAVKIPLVPAAVLFDLFVGEAKVRPGAREGYQACLAAKDSEVAEGSVGAGTGAAVGKILGRERATKGGLGTASQRISEDIIVAAIVAVNAFGDIIDPKTGEILAGPRQPEGRGFSSTVELLKSGQTGVNPLSTNTVIGAVATNAPLDKEQVNKLAQMANSGLAQAIRPCHTMVDGDTLFALSLGEGIRSEVNITQIGAVAAEVVADAIVRAVTKAQTLGGVPAVRDVKGARWLK